MIKGPITIWIILICFVSCNTKDSKADEGNFSQQEQAVKTSKRVEKAEVGDEGKFLENLISINPDFDMKSLHGKILYIDNWATWCAPCMKSNKAFVEKYATLKDIEDLVFVFVSFDLKEKTWREHVENSFPKAENIIHFYHGFDTDTNYGNYYGISSLPTYLVVGQDGRISSLSAKSAIDARLTQF